MAPQLKTWQEIKPEIRVELEPILSDFETACKRGTCPNKQEYLDRCADDDAKAVLADELDYFEWYYGFRNIDSRFQEEDTTPWITRIQDYELVERVGSGTFADVYLAKRNNHPFAIKVPRENNAAANVLSMSQTEESALSRLMHERIVRFHESIVFDDRTVLVTDWVDGVSLYELLSDGALPLSETLHLAIEICEGLQYAHQRGVIHRDLSTRNIMIDHHGHVKILDFGLAKFLHLGNSNTNDGELVGSPAYMSPEQTRGDSVNVDHRTDIFAIGVVLYEMLTGNHPFKLASRQPGNEELLDLIRRHTPLPPSKLEPKVPEELDRVVAKALRKNPVHRYQSVKQLKHELIQAEPIITEIRSKRGVHRGLRINWLRFGGLVASIALIGLASLAILFDPAGDSSSDAIRAAGPTGAGNDARSSIEVNESVGGEATDLSLNWIAIDTIPRDAHVVFYPLDKRGSPVTSKPYDLGNAQLKTAKLPPGHYYVVAWKGEHLFHEVLRRVPKPNARPGGSYRHTGWLERDGLPRLPTIRLFDSAEFDDMLDAGDFLIEPTERRTAMVTQPHGLAQPVDTDGYMTNLTWDETVELLEIEGKRLPYFSELQSAQVNLGDRFQNVPQVTEWSMTVKQRVEYVLDQPIVINDSEVAMKLQVIGNEHDSVTLYQYQRFNVDNDETLVSGYWRNSETGFRGLRAKRPIRHLTN